MNWNPLQSNHTNFSKKVRSIPSSLTPHPPSTFSSPAFLPQLIPPLILHIPHAVFTRLSNKGISLATKSTTSRVSSASSSSANIFSRFYSTDEEQDIVIVGGGPGGYVAAIKAAQLGAKVTCVEKRGALGGTCLNVGCIPSKALLKSSQYYHEAQHTFEEHGVKVEGLSMDIGKMMEQKSSAVTGLTSGIEGLFKKNKVNYAKGHGTITGPNEVKVQLNDGGEQTIKTKNIIIATGSEPAQLPGTEVDNNRIVDSTGALEFDKVPKKMAVIGAGVIGLELGSVWSRLGADVTVIEFQKLLGSGMDEQMAKNFARILGKQGINFKFQHSVLGAKAHADGVTLSLKDNKKDKEFEEEYEYVLSCVGRRPYTENLGLEQVGVEMNGLKVKTDEHLRTNIPSIWAIGDVVDGPMLAHKAEEEGIMVAETIINGYGHVNYDAIPSVIYTHPEVAWVGKTEQQVKEEGTDYVVGSFPFMANSRARAQGDTDGLVKVITEKSTDKILGVHIINSIAGDMIAEAVLAVEYEASSEDVARTSHAHPSVAEAVKEACLAAHGKAIHI
eukprot:TRINITY_DN383_c0_g1_i2.p1 TRINITY_DN383_c0_g1~~TRINITY_DN383_c0_g1_i2.p1  ORF type:complete len:557 (-),score=215.95 TRINITY_DN383_c0_g1_i2:20-1690(-)